MHACGWVLRTLADDLRIADCAEPAKRHGCVGYGVLMKCRGLIGQRLVCKHSALLLALFPDTSVIE
jgi:hypothetical protein